MSRNLPRKHRNLLKGSDLEGRPETEVGEATPPSASSAPLASPLGKRLAMRPPPWDRSAAEAEPGSFGSWLRRQRELREISLRDIAERTKISLRYLEAMEDDRFDLLPAPVFAKGFLREYARYVGLSPDEVVNHWLSVQPAEDADSTAVRLFRGEAPREASDRAGAAARSARPSGSRSGSWVVRALVLLAVLVAAALVAGAVYYTVRHRGSRPTPAHGPGSPQGAAPARGESPLPAAVAPVPLPAPAPPPAAAQHAALSVPAAAPAATAAAAMPAVETGAPSPAGPSPIEVTLDFTRDCWVEAFVDGKKQISEERVPGEAIQLQAQEKVTLTLGNPSAVEAQVNGYSFDLPRGRQPVHDLVIDLDTLKALKDKHEAL